MIKTPLQKYKEDLQKAVRNAKVTEWFERYLNKSRGTGNTDTLILACQKKGATLITMNQAIAEQITARHKIKTISAGAAAWAATPGKSVVDNATIMLLVRENKQIQMLAEQLLQLMNQKGID